MALLVVLTTVLVPIPARAADFYPTEPFVVASFTLAKGEKWTLNVYNELDNAKITYKSSKSSVAAVSKKGVVTGKKPGSATITVTVKQGKDTYQAKTKIKVKSKITPAENIKRVNAGLNLIYIYAFELMELNGWMEDEDALSYLVSCAEIVEGANEMAKNTSAYTDEEIQDVLGAILTMAETMEELLPYLSEPSA